MSDRYRGKYRIPPARAPFWDYGQNAVYFITICTKNRKCWFGEISNGVMQLSAMGHIAESEWLKTFKMRPDMNLWMGEYVVMPNHFHAIIGIGENKYNRENDPKRGLIHTTDRRRDAMHCVSTNPIDTPNPDNCPATTNPKNQFGPQSNNLASIVRGFKIGVTKNAREVNPDFGWQPRYYDHIIRNRKSWHHISEYIINNPQKWNEDTLNPVNQ